MIVCIDLRALSNLAILNTLKVLNILKVLKADKLTYFESARIILITYSKMDNITTPPSK